MRPQGDILYIDQAAGHYGIYRPGGSFDLRHRWAKDNYVFRGVMLYVFRGVSDQDNYVFKGANAAYGGGGGGWVVCFLNNS